MIGRHLKGKNGGRKDGETEEERDRERRKRENPPHVYVHVLAETFELHYIHSLGSLGESVMLPKRKRIHFSISRPSIKMVSKVINSKA